MGGCAVRWGFLSGRSLLRGGLGLVPSGWWVCMGARMRGDLR